MKKLLFGLLVFLVFIPNFIAADGAVNIVPENPTTLDSVNCLVNGEVRAGLIYNWFVNGDLLTEDRRPVHFNPLDLRQYDLVAGDVLRCEAWAPNPFGEDHFLGSDDVVLIEPAAPNRAPIVDITAPRDGDTFVVGENIPFDIDAVDPDGDLIVSFRWDMGDGNDQIIVENHFYSYIAPGRYTITAFASDNRLTGQDQITINVQQEIIPNDDIAPVAEFDAVGDFCINSEVTFNALATTDDQDLLDQMNYEWDFGDGTPVVEGQGLIVVDHNYALPGNYLVRLTVTDTDGNQDSEAQNVEIMDCAQNEGDDIPPIPDFAMDVQGPIACAGANIKFDARATVDNQDNINQMNYEWDFGDGTPVVEGQGLTQPDHIFVNPGNYFVSLTVTDTDGNTARFVVQVIVNDCEGELPPTVEVDVILNDPQGRACAGRDITLSALRSTDDQDPLDQMNYEWDFGDGTPVVEGQGLVEINHNYALPGNYLVLLIVTDTDGNIGAVFKRILVEDCEAIPNNLGAPVIDLKLDFDPNNVCIGQTLNADATGTTDEDGPRQNLFFAWDFHEFNGIGVPEQVGFGLDIVRHVYGEAGNYVLRFTVYDPIDRLWAGRIVPITVNDCRGQFRHDWFDVVSVRPTTYKTAYAPGETLLLAVDVRNSGNVDEQIAMTTSVSTLGVIQRERGFDSKRGSVETRFVYIQIPLNSNAGWHVAKIDLFGDRGLSARGIWPFYVG